MLLWIVYDARGSDLSSEGLKMSGFCDGGSMLMVCDVVWSVGNKSFFLSFWIPNAVVCVCVALHCRRSADVETLRTLKEQSMRCRRSLHESNCGCGR